MASIEGTSLTGDPTSLIDQANKFGRAVSVTPDNKVMRKKSSFAESLHKYQRIAEQKQSNRLRDQSWNSSSPKAKKHQRLSHWSPSFIPSMHVPWTTYSGINSYIPYFCIIFSFLFTTINIIFVMHQRVTLGRYGQIRASIV
jgi:hypothetical protein